MMIKAILSAILILGTSGCALHVPYKFLPDDKIAAGLKDGVYQGAVNERLDEAEVAVTISAHRIKKVDIVNVSAFGWRKKAIQDGLPEQFVSKQSVAVDAVSGATGSTHAVKIAVSRALEKAVPVRSR